MAPLKIHVLPFICANRYPRFPNFRTEKLDFVFEIGMYLICVVMLMLEIHVGAENIRFLFNPSLDIDMDINVWLMLAITIILLIVIWTLTFSTILFGWRLPLLLIVCAAPVFLIANVVLCLTCLLDIFSLNRLTLANSFTIWFQLLFFVACSIVQLVFFWKLHFLENRTQMGYIYLLTKSFHGSGYICVCR